MGSGRAERHTAPIYALRGLGSEHGSHHPARTQKNISQITYINPLSHKKTQFDTEGYNLMFLPPCRLLEHLLH